MLFKRWMYSFLFFFFFNKQVLLDALGQARVVDVRLAVWLPHARWQILCC